MSKKDYKMGIVILAFVVVVVSMLASEVDRGIEWSYYYSWMYLLPVSATVIGLLIGMYVLKRLFLLRYGHVVTIREGTKYGVLAFTGFWLYEMSSMITFSIKSIDGGMRVYFTEGYFEYTTLMYGLMYVVVVGLILLMLSMMETVAYFGKKREKKVVSDVT